MSYEKETALRITAHRSRSVAGSLSGRTAQAIGFVDNRGSTAVQRKLAEGMNNAKRLGSMAGLLSNPAQRLEDEELEQDKLAATQRVGKDDEASLLGKPAGNTGLVQRQQDAAPAENKTGLPDNLKAGIESLSGMDISDVRVHRNSSKPAQLNALAYAQGTDIHLGAGQERHLPHEAWHVVQQRQGRVKPTMQMAGTQINDDISLEAEADVMGGKALQMKTYNASVTVKEKITSSDLNDWGEVRRKLGGIANGASADGSIASNVNASLTALGLATGNTCMSAHMIPNRIGGAGNNSNVRPWDSAFETGTWETDVEQKFNQKLVAANKDDTVNYTVNTADMSDSNAQDIINKSTVVSEKTKPEHKLRIKKIPLSVSADVGGATLASTDECYKNIIK